jgi:hypothetical protein
MFCHSIPLELGSNVCKLCPTGADHCFKDQIVVTEGHWRINDRAEVLISIIILS